MEVTNTPNLSAQPPNQPGIWVPASLQKELTWLQKHERLLIVLVVLLAGSWGLNHFLNNSAADSAARATIAEQALASQKTLDTQLAQQNAQVAQQYQDMVKQLATQNATLSAANVARQEALGKQQQVNAQLPLSALSSRLQSLAQAPQGSVSNTETEVNLTQPGALAVTNALETIPVLAANLTNETTIAQNNAAQVVKANEVIATQGTLILGLNLETQKADAACKAEVKSVQAAARKSKWAWFRAGTVVGFLGGVFAGRAIP